MYLIDTNVISEKRKGAKANPGVLDFWRRILVNEDFLPSLVAGELRRGVEILKNRGDRVQAEMVEAWLDAVLNDYADRILDFDEHAADIWGRIVARSDQNPIDKQIAAIALLYDLTVVTRNVKDFIAAGVKVLNPFEGDLPQEGSLVP
jgi:predicted nucleic acid-binding protein